jgi:superfamily II DNA or RNA helicase
VSRDVRQISIETARQLLDFSGGKASQDPIWEGQLEGAVALHNILVREKIAYLADEVGMGKTYVALGVVALFRHFNPGWRVLYITPRENIQQKWQKELRNFTAGNWRVSDNRVRSFQRTPAYGLAVCNNLIDLARGAVINPNRDFLGRMTSFSLPMPKDSGQWTKRREALRRQIPRLDKTLFDLRSKEQFKDNYARAINAVLPHFDLLVIDEGQNLKHGLGGSAARNRLIAYVLGHPAGADPRFPGYGRRFDRLLVLSATPLESDYRELWNQLDLFGHGESWKILCASDPDKGTDKEKERTARRFLVRRLTGMTIAGQKHTKNMYRREWRNGGVATYDDPLPVADERQRLIVALVQKKVSEVISSEKFNNRFQIGMLASFESFLETAIGMDEVKQPGADEVSTFDDPDQAQEQVERDGIDTPSINTLAESYRRQFRTSLPHPKMDAVAESLKASFASGEKSLVFVRRVKSVDELTEKLNRHYDSWLKDRLLHDQPVPVQEQLRQVFDQYEEERRLRRRVSDANAAASFNAGMSPDEEERPPSTGEEEDEGDNSNFFAWFFRGKGPAGWFSGAALNENRLRNEGSAYSTFFEDNYVTWLLGEVSDPTRSIAKQTGASVKDTEQELRAVASGIFISESKQRRFPRRRVFRAYQEAALALLADARDNTIAEKARVIRRERFSASPVGDLTPLTNFPSPNDFLTARTFFTELAKRPDLRAELWPEEAQDDFVQHFRRREQRRELLLAAARLGHPFIDLWQLAVNQFGTLEAGAQKHTEGRAESLISDYLDLLEGQRRRETSEYSAFRELAEIARNFDLILAVNFPTVRDEPLNQLPRIFGSSLARQTPVGGMWGGVNQSLVRQFRMPGYPLILVTTDVLQEGEDLHTFCARVIHYGISWTPSAMEQRIGRVDRIRSLTQRRLDNQPKAEPNELLQVYYPHLHETVERLQVERVYERMNRFIRMMHRSLSGEQIRDSRVNTLQDFILRPRDIEPIIELLETAFPIQDEWLRTDLPTELIVAEVEAEITLTHFKQMVDALKGTFYIEPDPQSERWSYFGTAFIRPDGHLVMPGEQRTPARRQPFTLFLRTLTGDGRVLLRCVSPIGVVPRDDDERIERICAAQQRIGFGKVCAVEDISRGTYNLGSCSLRGETLTTSAKVVKRGKTIASCGAR